MGGRSGGSGGSSRGGGVIGCRGSGRRSGGGRWGGNACVYPFDDLLYSHEDGVTFRHLLFQLIVVQKKSENWDHL